MSEDEIIDKTNWFTLKYAKNHIDLTWDACGERGYGEAKERFLLSPNDAVFCILRVAHMGRFLTMHTVLVSWCPDKIMGFDRARVSYHIDTLVQILKVDGFVLVQATREFHLSDDYLTMKIKKITKISRGKFVVDDSIYKVRRQTMIEILEKEERKRRSESRMSHESFSFKEILTTEQHYVRSLKLFQEVFVNPMEEFAFCAVIYRMVKPSLETILGINAPFLEKLEKCYKLTAEERSEGERIGKKHTDLINCVKFELEKLRKRLGMYKKPSQEEPKNEIQNEPKKEEEEETEGEEVEKEEKKDEEESQQQDVKVEEEVKLTEEKETIPKEEPKEDEKKEEESTTTTTTSSSQPTEPETQQKEEDSSSLTQQLSEAISGVNDIRKMVDVLEETVILFKLYLPYIKVYNMCLEHYQKLMNPPPEMSQSVAGRLSSSPSEAFGLGDNQVSKKKEEFRKFIHFVELKLDESGVRSTDFQSFLIMPIQRIPRYQLLMKELLKKTTTNDPNYKRIEEALNTVGNIARYIDSKKNEVEMSDKTIKIARAFKMNDLMVFPRKMVRFCNCIFWKQKLRSEIFLFTDLLLICYIHPADSEKKGKSKCERVMFDADVRCYINPKDETEKSFIVETQRKNHVVNVSTKDLSNDMVNTIQTALSKCVGRMNTTNQFAHRTIYSSWIEKQGGGTFSFSMKKRWHVLSADMKMKYFDRPSGKMKGSYSVIGATIGKGFPDYNTNKKQQQFLEANQTIMEVPREEEEQTDPETKKRKMMKSQSTPNLKNSLSTAKRQSRKKFGLGSLFGGGKKSLKVNKGLGIGSFETRYVCWFYIETPKRTYYLVAESVPFLENWVKILELVGCKRVDCIPEKVKKWQEDQLETVTMGRDDLFRPVPKFAKFMRMSPITMNDDSAVPDRISGDPSVLGVVRERNASGPDRIEGSGRPPLPSPPTTPSQVQSETGGEEEKSQILEEEERSIAEEEKKILEEEKMIQEEQKKFEEDEYKEIKPEEPQKVLGESVIVELRRPSRNNEKEETKNEEQKPEEPPEEKTGGEEEIKKEEGVI